MRQEKKRTSPVTSTPPLPKGAKGTKSSEKGRQRQEINAHLTERIVRPTPPPPRRLVRAPVRNLPKNLVRPSPIVSVELESIYTQALWDTEAQVMLLYQDLYHKYLKHIPLCKLEEFEIWGIGTQKCTYDGYIPIKITFDPAMAGKPETFDTLAVVCP